MSLIRKSGFLLIPTILFSLICLTVMVAFEPGERLFGMLFHRSFVQFLTVYVFALIVTLLGRRLRIYVRAKRHLKMVQKDKQKATISNLAFGEEPDIFRRELIENGGDGAVSCVDQLVKAWKDRISKAYGFINFLAYCLPALGLFGTMVGLSGSLFAAFGRGDVGPDAVKQFVAGLATALDTTVLALCCFLIVGGLIWLMNRLEDELSERQAGFVRKALLERLFSESAVSKPAASADNHLFSLKSVFRAELRAITAEILEGAMSKFEQKLRDITESYCVNLERSVDIIFSEQRAHEQALVEKVASQLDRSVDHIGVLIERHNNHAVKVVASRLKRIAGTLDKRIPGELIIRYERNGEPDLEDHDDI